jgi:hypothetical protein
MDAPADVHAYVLYRRLPAKGNSWTEQARSRVEGLKDRVPAFEARWPGSRAAAWLRLEYAMALENSGAFDSAKPELEKVLATAQDQVGAADPIRIIATVHLSTLKSHEGDNAAARRMLAESGLNAQQCSLFDIRPVATNSSVSSNDFPQEALLWRFEGYVREDYDIAANGQPTNIRTVIAYPPFVFERGTERILNKFRYLPPVVDGMAVGCLGKTLNINYTIPK